MLAAMKPPPRRRGPPLGDERILLRTNRGDLVLGLYDTVAPKHAAQIRKLVRLGVYDSTTIFRIEPGYLAQIINAQNRQKPLTSAQSKAITPIPAEFSKLPHRTGTLSMARDDDDVNSAETSFSIILGRAADLDREYTVFGEVEGGQPLLAVLGREKRDYRNKPLVPVVVERAEVKTAAEIERMRTAGELRAPSAQPLPALPPPPAPPPAASPAPPAPAPR
jgi:cyclophilin family peptidyl-prolyl cis-trans isomerase